MTVYLMDGRALVEQQEQWTADRRFIFLFPSSRAPREISRSPRLAHKAPVMQANLTQGTRLSKKLTNNKDVKRYLKVSSKVKNRDFSKFAIFRLLNRAHQELSFLKKSGKNVFSVQT